MIKRMLLIAALALFLAAASRQGMNPTIIYRTSAGSVNLLEDVALNDTEENRTITLNTNGWSKLRVAVYYSYSSSTLLTIILKCSLDNGTKYARIQSRDISSGTSTLYDFSDTKLTLSGDRSFMPEFGVKGCSWVKITFSGTPAGSGDLVTVQATAISET